MAGKRRQWVDGGRRKAVLTPTDDIKKLAKPEFAMPVRYTATETATIARLAAELVKRKTEALSLYEPLPAALPFHESDAAERLLIGSNRAGKSLSGCVEIARAVTGQDPFKKYPKTDGRAIIVGKDGKLVGEVLWRYLNSPGAFKVVRDLQTREWRTARPWEPSDWERRSEWRASPPLIPRRLIKKIAWENKGQNIPAKVLLKNGWELLFFSGNASPLHGVNVDLVYFSEDIENERWYPEMCLRLVDRQGKFIWDTTPQMGTQILYELHQQAQKGTERIKEFKLLLKDNPYLPEDAKKQVIEKLGANPNEKKVRIDGEFAILTSKIFPQFTEDGPHVINPQKVPDDWTRYVAIDPGNAKAATLWCAVPPPTEEHRFAIYVYDELFIEGCTANIWGKAFAKKCEGQVIETIYFDEHRGRISDDSGMTIIEQYQEAALRNGFTGARKKEWEPACDKVDPRIERGHHYLEIQPDGLPRLFIMRSRCPALIQQLRNYRYQSKNGFPVLRSGKPTPVTKGETDTVDCLLYLCAANPKWVEPPVRSVTQWEAERRKIQKKLAQHRRDWALATRRAGRAMGMVG